MLKTNLTHKMRSFLKYVFSALLLVSVLAGCDKEYESIEEVDERKIQSYITAQNLTLVKDSSGFYYQILSPGTGEAPKNSEIVYYTYTAKSVDGKEYFTANSYASGSGFLGYVRPEGWRLALNKINKGGKIRVVFPSSLGFGRNPTNGFDGNEVLDSELELFNSQPELDDVLINRFMTGNALSGFNKTSGGVYYKVIAPGTGTEPVKLTDSITAAYTGRLLKGSTFDSATTAAPLKTRLELLIKGWQEAVPFIKKGGKIRILIPSAFGYGNDTSKPTIPPNSVLDFDVELIDVKTQ